MLKGETTAAEAARRHGLKVAEVEDWRDRFLLGAENALRARPKEDEALREEDLNRFKRKVGELTIDLDILRRPQGALRRRGRPTSDSDVARRIDATSVQSSEVFPCPAAGARGNCGGTAAAGRSPGGTHSTFDRTVSDVWLSAALGDVAFCRRDPREPQGGVSIADAQRLVRPSTFADAGPRVQGRRSRAQRSDERWAMDVTHIPCGADGWGHLTAVIDCHDREVTGYEFALRGRAKEAERALEEACLARFGTSAP